MLIIENSLLIIENSLIIIENSLETLNCKNWPCVHTVRLHVDNPFIHSVRAGVVDNFAQQYSYNGVGLSGVPVYLFPLIIFHIVYSSLTSDIEEQMITR